MVCIVCTRLCFVLLCAVLVGISLSSIKQAARRDVNNNESTGKRVIRFLAVFIDQCS